MWIMNRESNHMERREITYVPGLFKIFDEILVNACDNKQRDPKMNCIKITINQYVNWILFSYLLLLPKTELYHVLGKKKRERIWY